MNKAVFLVATLCLPLPAFAEMTSVEVWEEIQGSLVEISNEQDITITIDVGDETIEDDGLLLTDVTVTVEGPEEIGTASIDWIRFQDTSDGSVEMTLNPITNLLVEETRNVGEGKGVVFDVIQSGYLARVSGEIGDYTADTVAKYIKIAVPIPEEEANGKGIFSVLMKGITSQVEVSSDVSNLFSDMALAIDTISMKVDFTGTRPRFDLNNLGDDMEPRPEVFAFTSEISNFRVTAQEEETGLDHEISSFEELPEMQFLASIAGANVDFSYSGFNYSGVPVSAAIVASAGAMRSLLSVNSKNISAEAVAQAFVANVDLDTIEVTDVFDVSLDEIGYRLNVDIDLDNGRAEGNYRENIDNLLLSSSFWDLFDPEITIPRDPLSSVMDVTGELLVEPDSLDVEDMESANTDVFKTLHLTLNQYLLSGGGVRIEATGEAELDMDGIDLDDDEPKMSASMHLDLQGAFDLIGKLLELEIIPADIAFGARTIIGMVGVREGDGDHFVSDISIDENGDLTVNGKPFEIPN